MVFSSSSWASKAEVLLISDIDDTIKISHVLNTWDALKNAFAFESRFRGMADVYRRLSADRDFQVAYVSNAPEVIMKGAHKRLLREGWFPSGPLRLRRNFKGQEHKKQSILKLSHRFDPSLVILVGDNGESDVHTYHEMAKILREQGREVITYIHQVYSDDRGAKLYPDQIGFVTAVDLSVDLLEKGIVSEEFHQDTALRQVPSLVTEIDYKRGKPAYFPSWLNCSDYKWVWGKQDFLTEMAKTRILNRCQCSTLF